MAVGAVGLYIYGLKIQNTALIESNKTLSDNNSKMSLVNATQQITIDELEKQQKNTDRIAIKRSNIQQSIASSTSQSKTELKVKLRDSEYETDVIWADELVPDVVVGLLNDDTGSGSANTSGENYAARTVDTGLRHSEVFRPDKPRPDPLHF